MKKQVPPVRRPAAPKKLPAFLPAAALRAQSEGVFIAERSRGGRKLTIVFVNESLGAMLGYAPEELVGKTPGLLHADTGGCPRFARWVKMNRPGVFTGEGRLARKDLTLLNAAWNYSPVFDERGKYHYVIASFRDTTEMQQLEQALVNAQRLDAVGRLAGGVAHDFNNLLSVINGYCEMLAPQVSHLPRALHEVTEIHQAGRKAALLTRQLLAFGRRQPMVTRVLNVNQLVRENAEILSRALGSVGHLELDLDDSLRNIFADPTQLQQVLLNLVLNARDAMQEGGRVTITTRSCVVKGRLKEPGFKDVPPGRYLKLSVQDNGSGMDETTLKQLFEPFFTTKPVGRGSGLGLAMVYGVIQQSDGHIAVTSKVGHGSTFDILLPNTNKPADARPSTEPVSVPLLPTTHGNETVLLVERNEVLRKLVSGLMASDGYRVIDAATVGELKVKAGARLHLAELAILNLSDENEKLVRKLHAKQPGLRVLNLCNHSNMNTVAWLAPRRQACLPKPFALSELLRAVRKLLDA